MKIVILGASSGIAQAVIHEFCNGDNEMGKKSQQRKF